MWQCKGAKWDPDGELINPASGTLHGAIQVTHAEDGTVEQFSGYVEAVCPPHPGNNVNPDQLLETAGLATVRMDFSGTPENAWSVSR
ncbi:MAG: hypothetical protein B7733_15760 [Myxococcales bacterium FL481]|nr:MAG: hypothetical protein B7733_15760 [Myxococcales bacterium FL481]